MKNTTKKIVALSVAGLVALGSLSACATPTQDLKDREALQDNSKKDSLELKNLAAT